MTETSSTATRRRIREIFDLVVAEGLRPDAVAGASEEQVRAWAASQGVSTVPAAVAEVFGLLGIRQGPWWYGSTAAIVQLDDVLKDMALECLHARRDTLSDSKTMLLLLAHGGSEFHVVDGVDLQRDDPPVWRIVRGDVPRPHWNGVTVWFESAAVSVRAMLRRLRRTVEDHQKGDHELALQQFFVI